MTGFVSQSARMRETRVEVGTGLNDIPSAGGGEAFNKMRNTHVGDRRRRLSDPGSIPGASTTNTEDVSHYRPRQRSKRSLRRTHEDTHLRHV